MAKETEKSKGGRKGGTLYPKVTLDKAVQYSKKLVSKTHTGLQPKNIILPGVFGAGSWLGEVKLSGTKQFGLVSGNASGYGASDLAKRINSATPEELPKLLSEACLKPKIFKTLYDTFVNDAVTDAKIKQQFLNHDVHPDSADECVTIFKSSLVYAGLAKLVEGDKLQVLSIATEVGTAQEEEMNEEELTDVTDDEAGNHDKAETEDQIKVEQRSNGMNKPLSNINVNIDVDPSMDPEKLEKLLKLLKNYGAI